MDCISWKWRCWKWIKNLLECFCSIFVAFLYSPFPLALYSFNKFGKKSAVGIIFLRQFFQGQQFFTFTRPAEMLLLLNDRMNHVIWNRPIGFNLTASYITMFNIDVVFNRYFYNDELQVTLQCVCVALSIIVIHLALRISHYYILKLTLCVFLWRQKHLIRLKYTRNIKIG